MDSFLTKGGDKIEQVILTGCSGIVCVFSKALAENIKGLLEVCYYATYNISITKKIFIGVGVYTVHPTELYVG